ncbi:hypothetical protein BCF33_1515 [Hasllibacter halocynthiae]|uniref:Glycosyl transferase family 2 n=1 Tax=Hasllibacter halocynthiae TaxID=595589 RepID=A0A2T0X140_9RHOB|nr:hypothetical protein [Hasllibacter halocynthiae]PRY92662.1 hypothetical protein BCF33_1515 [Hasllibacter halocynthiae]
MPSPDRPAARHESLDALLGGRAPLGTGPAAIVLCEDGAEVAGTLRHLLADGFGRVVAVLARGVEGPALSGTDEVPWPRGMDFAAVVSRVAAACPGQWLHYCFNAEYLFHPFHGSRTVGEMLSFVAEERRGSVLCYVVDLYAGDLGAHPDAVDVEGALLDGFGYYAQARRGPDGEPLERQLDFHGGLRWRFEEHVPRKRRRIDRIGLFRALPGLRLNPDHTLSEPELNTYACPWHNNPTAAICSFRTAKALKTNPGSMYEIERFAWHGSEPFRWDAQQLLDLGLMEPGQWF